MAYRFLRRVHARLTDLPRRCQLIKHADKQQSSESATRNIEERCVVVVLDATKVAQVSSRDDEDHMADGIARSHDKHSCASSPSFQDAQPCLFGKV